MKQSKRDKYLRKTYGITEAQYKSALKAQGNKCAMCGKKQSDVTYSLHQDHNHKSGRNRGIVCYYCNKFRIGRHDLQSATSLYEYMRRYEDPLYKQGA